MDYSDLVNFHRETNADVTIASTPADEDHATHLGILQVSGRGGLLCFSNGAAMRTVLGCWVILAPSGAQNRQQAGRQSAVLQ